jgi:hypothetical protein
MIERAHLDPTIKKEDYAWVAGLYVTDGTPLRRPMKGVVILSAHSLMEWRGPGGKLC